MNAELKAQSNQIDGITETTERQQSRVARDIQRTAAVGGRSAKKAAKDSTAAEGVARSAAKAAAGAAAGAAGAAGGRPVSGRMAAIRAMQGL